MAFIDYCNLNGGLLFILGQITVSHETITYKPTFEDQYNSEFCSPMRLYVAAFLFPVKDEKMLFGLTVANFLLNGKMGS